MEFNFAVAYSFWTNGFDDTWKWHKMIFNTQRVAVVLISYVEIVWHLWTIKSVRCEFVDTVENSIFMMLGFSHSITLFRLQCVRVVFISKCITRFNIHYFCNEFRFIMPRVYDCVRVCLCVCVFAFFEVHKLPRICSIIRTDNSANKMHKHFNAPFQNNS